MALSHKNDLHTFAVQRELRDEHGLSCHVIEIDDQMHNGAIAWSEGTARLRDTAGEWVDVADIGVIWPGAHGSLNSTMRAASLNMSWSS